MNLSYAFVGLVAGIVIWALLVRRLTAKEWETQSPASAIETADAPRFASARIGLWTFLAVVTSLFGLFISAYFMRMEHAHGDWSPLRLPQIVWLNTALLVLASVAMQLARGAVKRGLRTRAGAALITGGLLTVAFLVGQLLAGYQLRASGYFVAGNIAVAFFYLLTAVHGLHLLGGLYVWARTTARFSNHDIEIIDLRLSVELCSVYWHYLLGVWLVLFALLLSN